MPWWVYPRRGVTRCAPSGMSAWCRELAAIEVIVFIAPPSGRVWASGPRRPVGLPWLNIRRWSRDRKWNKLDFRIPAGGTVRMNEFELLKTFCAAAEARNFKEAAARLGVSPQVVTRAIKHLEERLGETLFHRSTRQVRITAYGEQLARQGASILSTTTDMLRPAAKRARDEVEGTVRVAAPSAL